MWWEWLVLITALILTTVVLTHLLCYVALGGFGGRALNVASKRRALSLTRELVGFLRAMTAMHLPLATSVHVAGRGEPGAAGIALREMGKWLSHSIPVAEALRRAVPACPSLAVSMIDCGERSGQLRAALENLEDMLGDQLHPIRPSQVNYWAYPTAMVGFTLMMLSGLMIVIVPKFREIFDDYGADLPPTTINLIGASRWFVTGSPPGWSLVVFVSMSIAVALGVCRHIHVRGGTRSRTLAEELISRIKWRVPGLRQMEYGYGMSAMTRVFGMGLRAGMTLDRAAALAAETKANIHLQNRFDRFAHAVADGVAPRAAALSAELGPVFVGVVRIIERGEDVRPACRHAAEFYLSIAHRWWLAIEKAVWPATTLAVALVIAYIAVALFVPMTALVESVMSTMGGAA